MAGKRITEEELARMGIQTEDGLRYGKPKPASGFYIAIDPDVDKSGIALMKAGTKVMTLKAMRFPLLIESLQEIGEDIINVFIEAGWLNATANYHTAGTGKAAVGTSGRIGSYVGANAQVGKLIGEMCEHLGIKYTFVKPLKKRWKGPQKKITKREFDAQLASRGIEPIKTNNQEMRDAGLILLHYS